MYTTYAILKLICIYMYLCVLGFTFQYTIHKCADRGIIIYRRSPRGLKSIALLIQCISLWLSINWLIDWLCCFHPVQECATQIGTSRDAIFNLCFTLYGIWHLSKIPAIKRDLSVHRLLKSPPPLSSRPSRQTRCTETYLNSYPHPHATGLWPLSISPESKGVFH